MPFKTLINKNVFVCVYVSVVFVFFLFMLYVLLLGLEPVIKFISIQYSNSYPVTSVYKLTMVCVYIMYVYRYTYILYYEW